MQKNHESLLKRIVKAIGKAPVDNPELASAINDAQSALQKESVDSAATKVPGQEQRDISTAVSHICLRGGSIRLVVKQGDAPSMLVECSRASNLSYVLTEVAGSTLTISCKPATIVSGRGNSIVQINNGFGSVQVGNISIHGSSNVVRRVFSGDVVNTGPMTFTTTVDTRGNVISSTTGLDNPVIESDGRYLATVTVALPNVNTLDVSGSGEVEYECFILDDLSVDISGSGDVVLSGTANALDATISGSGTLSAGGLVSKSARLQVSGSGRIKASVSEKVKAKVSGSGDVKVMGNPPIRDTKVTGSGEIKFK